MKRWIGVLVLCLMLAGCQNGVEPTTTITESIPTETPWETTVLETEASTPPVEESSWLEEATAWNGMENLFCLPLEEGFDDLGTNYLMMGDRMLVYGGTYVEDRWVEGNMALVDLATGRILAKNAFPDGANLTAQYLDGTLYLLDNGEGRIYRLDGQLRVEQQWTVEGDYNTWILGSGEQLYRLSWDGLVREDLHTGIREDVCPGASRICLDGTSEELACISYSDPELGRMRRMILNLKTGQIQTLDFPDGYSSGQWRWGYWLFSRYEGDVVTYCLDDPGGQRWTFTGSTEVGYWELTDDGRLLCQQYESSSMTLWDGTGRFVDRCTYDPEGEGYYSWPPVWSEKWNGYILYLENSSNGDHALVLWIPEQREEPEENLVLTPVEWENQEDPPELEPLRERARELGQRYGLTIWMGSECQQVFDDFTAQRVFDPEILTHQLDILERALESYPQGFFRQLCYESYQTIHIQLVSQLVAGESYDGTGNAYGAFVQPRSGYYLMVVNTDYSAVATYYHEFSHIIDDYLEWDSWQREDALFSEEEWEKRNPEGFSYTYDYGVSQDYQDDWETYFVDHYAMTNPTEDRARVLEYASMEFMDRYFRDSPGLMEKLRYYAACIRDGFDTTGWPETTIWEQFLPMENTNETGEST